MKFDIYLSAFLILLCACGGLTGAAGSQNLSFDRVMNLIVAGGSEDHLETDAPVLYKGIQYFTGTPELARNFKEAQAFFYKAIRHRDLKVRAKASLYNAVILFLGGDGLERNPVGAKYILQEIIESESATDSDRIRACIFLDQMMHTVNGGVPLNLVELRDSTAKVGSLCPSSGALADELCYRTARAYTYEDGRDKKKCIVRASMCLNPLFNATGSLADDIKNLRSQISDASPVREFGGMFYGMGTKGSVSAAPVASSPLQPMVQAPAPVRLFGGFVSQNNSTGFLSHDVFESPKKDEEVPRSSFRKSPAYCDLSVLANDDSKKESKTISRSPIPKIAASTLKLAKRDASSENSASSSSSSPDQILAQQRVVRLDRPLTPEDWRVIRALKHERNDKKAGKGKYRDKKKYRKQ